MNAIVLTTKNEVDFFEEKRTSNYLDVPDCRQSPTDLSAFFIF